MVNGAEIPPRIRTAISRVELGTSDVSQSCRRSAAAAIGGVIHFGTGTLVMVVGLYGGRPEPGIWLFTVFAGAGGAISASPCALIVNIYLVPSSEA